MEPRCPVVKNGDGFCMGSRCRWWMKEEKECAISLIAKRAIDAGITAAVVQAEKGVCTRCWGTGWLHDLSNKPTNVRCPNGCSKPDLSEEKCGICGRGLVDGQCPDDTGFPEPPEELKSFIVGKDYVNTSYVRVMAKNEGEAKQKAEGGGPLVIGIQDQFKCWLDCDQWSVQEDK